MNLTGFLYALATVPMFAARPFLAAFLTALLARFGPSIPWIGDSAVVIALSHAPPWFKGEVMLAVLFVLALGEALSAKHAEVRALMSELDGYIKAAVAILVSLALVDEDTAGTIRAIDRHGFAIEGMSSVLVGGLVYAMSALRRSIFEHVFSIDDHDDLGLQSVLSWAENAWTVLGILFLVIFPIVALVLAALTAVGLLWIRRRAEAREQRSKIPCSTCATPIFPHATVCHACRTVVSAPRAVGVFGQPKDTVAPNLELHRFDLVGRKRCPDCASRLVERAVRQRCRTCGTVTFASELEFRRYLDALDRRLPRTLLVCLGLSAVPVLGVVPGVVYYRLALVTGLRGYIPPLSGCMARLLVRLVDFGVIALQPIPILGALIVPLMCASTFWIYRRALVGRAEGDLSADLPAQIVSGQARAASS